LCIQNTNIQAAMIYLNIAYSNHQTNQIRLNINKKLHNNKIQFQNVKVQRVQYKKKILIVG